MKCLLDLDGVLVDLMTSLRIVFDIYIEDYPVNDYDIARAFRLKSQDEVWNHPKVLDPNFWATLPKMPEADSIVKLLTSKFGKKNICIFTSPVLDHNCLGGKVKWIEKHYPQFKRQFLVGPAKEFVAGPRKLLIDDYEKNIDGFVLNGGDGILVPAHWNSLYPLKNRVVDYLTDKLKVYE